MKDNESGKQIALDTLRILDQGFFISSSQERIEINDLLTLSLEGTKIYTPKESDELIKDFKFPAQNFQTEYRVVNKPSLEVTRELFLAGNKDVLCLNFASAKKPGGYFKSDSIGQEESITRLTGLYKCLKSSPEYYEANRKFKSAIYTDYMIYSPYVPIIKNEDGETLNEKMYCGIITVPAVNKGIVKKKEPEKINEIEIVMKSRIRKVLTVSLMNNHNSLVLGAWGCGIFQNDPNEIARYFREILDEDFKNRFKKIVFAISDSNEYFIKPFYHEFG